MPSARWPQARSRRMQGRLAAGLALIGLALVPPSLFGAAAQAPSSDGVSLPGATFLTARGVPVRTPSVQSLDCAAMRRVLDAIDDSGYRDGSPDPLDPADRALLDYENRLSGRYYETCVRKPARAEPLAPAFARGYDRQP